jgi:CarD family transcriptional regulator
MSTPAAVRRSKAPRAGASRAAGSASRTRSKSSETKSKIASKNQSRSGKSGSKLLAKARSKTSISTRTSASKASGSRKPMAKGAKSRMIANKNKKTAAPAASKKTAAAERTSKKAAEQARKPLAAKKPAETKPAETKRPAAPAKKPAEAKRPATAAKKPIEHAKPAAEKRPAEQARKPVEIKKVEAKVEPRKPALEAVKKPAELHPVARKAPEPVAALKKTNQRQGFKTQEFIVYPAHGVGQITAIEEQEVAGYRLELFVISFAKDKMTLRVPTTKVASVGMRKLAEPTLVKRSLDTLKGRARIKRTMWSRRAQEYEAKINSGDIVAIAEVVRDLYRSESQPEQSYSERQLYEAALDRLAREVGAVERVTETEAVKLIEAALAKGPRRGAKPEGEEEALVEEAA